MIAKAFAKLNLSLTVDSRRGGLLHGIVGMFQSIDWHDVLDVSKADKDELTGPAGAQVIDGRDNLAWLALMAVRSHAGSTIPVRLQLDKRLPVAAGLGGGSADAAAAMGAAGKMFGVTRDDLRDIGPSLGSDVPFCFVGGRAVVSGTGEEVLPLPPADGYGLGVVVPPIEISTTAVYQEWDRLNGPSGIEVSGRFLPPTLRGDGPFANDLYPAAVAIAPGIDDWRSELSHRWSRPVMLTGSGPALFGYFVDKDEALSAVRDIPLGARSAAAARPVGSGWEIQA